MRPKRVAWSWMDGECDFGAVGLESVEGAFFAG